MSTNPNIELTPNGFAAFVPFEVARAREALVAARVVALVRLFARVRALVPIAACSQMSASFLEAATHRTADARGSTILKAAEVQTITDALSTLAVTDEESIRCAAQAMDRETLRRCRGNLAKLKDVLDDICESATPELCRFPPGRPDIELYSQMLETTSNRIDHFEFGAHVYINGQKLRPEGSRYEGFRVVQFEEAAND